MVTDVASALRPHVKDFIRGATLRILSVVLRLQWLHALLRSERLPMQRRLQAIVCANATGNFCDRHRAVA